jgi:hypothetical protein
VRLKGEQILKMAEAIKTNGNGDYYIEQDSDGKIRFGAIAIIEKELPIALGKIQVPE